MPVTGPLAQNFKRHRRLSGIFRNDGVVVQIQFHKPTALPAQRIEDHERPGRHVNLIRDLAERLLCQCTDGLLALRDVLILCCQLPDGLLAIRAVHRIPRIPSVFRVEHEIYPNAV